MTASQRDGRPAMTRDEFAAGPSFVLDGGWPGDFTTNDEDAYYYLLNDHTAPDIMRALKALRHQKYRPSASEIANVLAPAQAATPTFDEMFALLFSPRGALAAPGEQGTRDRLATMHPLVAAFAERQGIQRLKELPVHDPDDGHWRRKELRDAWTAHVDAFDGRELVTLATGQPRGGLHRLDPLAALTASRPDIAAGLPRTTGTT
jgi:hypothetical protein